MQSIRPARVVCGITDSDHAETVVNVARALADGLGLPIEVVSSPSDDRFTVGSDRASLLDAGRHAIDEALADDVDEVTILPGPPHEVLQASMRDGAVIGVVGSRGRGAFRSALFGSVSTTLARSAPCPLVVVPPGARVPDLSRGPVLACRFDGTPADLKTVRIAARLAAAVRARMLHINVAGTPGDLERSPISLIEQELDGLPPIRSAIRTEIGEPLDAIRDIARRDQAQLIVAGAPESRLQTMIGARTLASRLMAGSTVPVMVIPPDVDDVADRRQELVESHA